jgi:hypothetical protein
MPAECYGVPPVGYTTEQSSGRVYRVLVEALTGYLAGTPVHMVN